MNAKLALLVRVIFSRLENGEQLNDVLADYPKLTEQEIQVIRQCL